MIRLLTHALRNVPFDVTFTPARCWKCAFALLAITLLISGIDDLIPLAIRLNHYLKPGAWRIAQGGPKLLDPPERRIAIFVPCWKESGVIGNMIRHNLAAIRYRAFDIFLGVYPNDEATVAVAEQLSATFKNVHVALCPHPGPTSKADCLNWAYHSMRRFEILNAAPFDTVVLHDAEDMIHPEALALINRERCGYDMVQVPVLPLPTPFWEITHGIYCDEFAEFQTIDMHARQFSGSFVPSNGVGTGFARHIFLRLEQERGFVFDAESLTEDYEIGVYIHDAGYRQLFAPLTAGRNGFVATREYFPRTTNTAIRQRSRWVTGIALQCWERHGWSGTLRKRYWFWRDRKGLIMNPLSLLTNVLFLAGLTDLAVSLAQRIPWVFAAENPKIALLCAWTLALQCIRIGIRMVCVGRIFGPAFALGVALRTFHGNLINCFASLRACRQFVSAKRAKQKLVWQKTEHAYPEHAALQQEHREFHHVLADCGFVRRADLDAAMATLPAQTELGEYLLAQGLISDEDLCSAISLYSGVPMGHFDARKIRRGVRQSLPAHVERRYNLVPVELRAGKLVVAGRQTPTPEALATIKSFTSLAVDFHLITQRNYLELRARF